MKSIKWFSLMSYFCFMLSQTVNAETGQTWTILVYGHADHNLSYSLMRDMLEMEKVGSGEGFNIVVQADYDGQTAEKYKGSFRYLMQKTDPLEDVFTVRGQQQTLSVPGTTPVEKNPELDLDKSDNLKDFIRWGIKKYPAKRYGLVFWDHGGQWKGGFGGDHQDGAVANPSSMKVAEIGKVLSEMRGELGLGKFDFITFDTCLLGGAELLPDMLPHTDTYIANAEIDFGDGWDYAATLGWLKANPNATMRTFAEEEVKHYQAHHSESEADKLLKAHAAFDLTQYAQYQKSAFQFFQALNDTNNWSVIQQTRSETTKYSLSSPAKLKTDTDYIDVGEFATRLTQTALPDNVKEAARTLTDSINKLIISKNLGTARQTSGAFGLSIYYPQKGLNDNYVSSDEYLNLSFISETIDSLSNKWASLLTSINKSAEQNTAPELTNSTPPAATTENETTGRSNSQVSVNDNNLAALRTSVISKTFGVNQQAVLENGQLTLPLVEIAGEGGEYPYYQASLIKNATGTFTIKDLTPATNVISGLAIASVFDPKTSTLDIPILKVGNETRQFKLTFKAETKELTLISDQAAEMVTYLDEVSYRKTSTAGNYAITWNKQQLTLKGGKGTSLPVSGFRIDPDSSLLMSTALYLPPDSDDVKLVMLQIDTVKNKVIDAFDGELSNGAAPRGLPLKAEGLLLPIYYSEIRTSKPAEEWLSTSLIGDIDPLVIPANGISGLALTNTVVASGSYLLEVVAEDTFGKTSTPQLFNILVP
jgi:hypothetical protein